MNGIMIALLPISADWSKVDIPHLTLAYYGKIEDKPITDLPKILKDAAALAFLNRTMTLRVLGLEVFGDEEKVDVFSLRLTPELMAMRNLVERWDEGKWPVYRPHVTIGPSPSQVTERPYYIAFDRVLLAWGNEKYVFKMYGKDTAAVSPS